MIHSKIDVPIGHPIVRAVVPLSAGDVRWVDGLSPFTLVNAYGDKLRTQACVVARDCSNQPKLVELLAFDHLAAGDEYSVVIRPQRNRLPTLTPWARKMFGAAPLFDAGSEQIATQWGRYFREGNVAVTRKFYGPHVVGWMTAFAGQDYVIVEFKLHNAAPNSPHWFFDMLYLNGDPSDGVVSFIHEPNQSGRTLIAPRADGKKHFLKQRQQREFRFVIHKDDAISLGLSAARLAGLGFSDHWTEVGAWGPAQVRLPHLPKPMLANMANHLRSESARIDNSLRTGASIDLGMSIGPTGRIGIGHVTGSYYGGVTGGGGRWLFDEYGAETALTGEVAGVLALMGKLSQIIYRMPALLEDNGGVCKLEDWIDANSQPLGDWEIGADANFERQGAEKNYRDGAFGFRAARQVPLPPDGTFDRDEFDTFDAIAPVDFQHYVRAFTATALIYLTNDPLAAHTVRELAEVHRMSVFTRGRDKSEYGFIRSNPGHGTEWGRAHGHGFDCQSIAYYISDSAWRSRHRGDLLAFSQAMINAQMPNGCIQSMRGNKAWSGSPFNSEHGIEKATEAVFLAFAAHEALIVALGQWSSLVVEFACNGLAVYHNGQNGTPTDYTAVAPASRGDAPYAVSPVSLNYDHTECPIMYGLALDYFTGAGLPPPPELTNAICRYCGNSSDPLGWLFAQSLYSLDINDSLPLISALERSL